MKYKLYHNLEEKINFSVAAIQNTDPSFEANVQLCGEDMFGGVNSMPGPANPPMQAQPIQSRRRVAHVKVVEQPASKSLR